MSNSREDQAAAELARRLTPETLRQHTDIIDGALERLNGVSPADVEPSDGLTPDELRICELTKCDPADFRKLKAERGKNIFETMRRREAAALSRR